MSDRMGDTPPAAPVPSPCLGLCRIEEASGLCMGCARSLDEIAAWGTLAEAAKARISAALPGRRAALGLPPVHPASPDREPPHAP